MTISGPIQPRVPSERSRAAVLAGALAFAVLTAAGLAWAKWLPYLHRLQVTASSGAYPGHDVLARAGAPGSSPSLSGAWAFTKAYGVAVWPALVAALAIAAAVEAFLPGRWLHAALGRGGFRGRLAGGLAGLPSMMCTCCTAPVARTLRRAGVPTETAVAYWLANPVLNPAVLAFLALVLPWQWVLTRLVVGGLLVFAGTGLVARAVARRPWGGPPPVMPAGDLAGAEAAPRRFTTALLRSAVVLVPEYFVVVLLVGLLRGWLLPLGHDTAHLALLATALAAVAGTLVVIPTAGEIPLVLGLAGAGLGAGPLGALLITLPAISLPSMAMVGRAFGWRVTALTAAAVAAAGLLSGALLWALTG